MGPIGFPEMLFILVLALLIFGPRKLPELGRTFGKAMAEFRKASAELRMTVESEVREMERQTQSLKDEANKIGRQALEGVVPAGLPSPSDLAFSDLDQPAQHLDEAPSAEPSNSAQPASPTDGHPHTT